MRKSYTLLFAWLKKEETFSCRVKFCLTNNKKLVGQYWRKEKETSWCFEGISFSHRVDCFNQQFLKSPIASLIFYHQDGETNQKFYLLLCVINFARSLDVKTRLYWSILSPVPTDGPWGAAIEYPASRPYTTCVISRK